MICGVNFLIMFKYFGLLFIIFSLKLRFLKIFLMIFKLNGLLFMVKICFKVMLFFLFYELSVIGLVLFVKCFGKFICRGNWMIIVVLLCLLLSVLIVFWCKVINLW